MSASLTQSPLSRVWLVVWLLVAARSATAQDHGSISGRVTDQRTGLPVVGASLSIVGGPARAASATGITALDGKIVYGLAAASGVGLFTYDPATGTATQSPVVSTAGSPTVVLAF